MSSGHDTGGKDFDPRPLFRSIERDRRKTEPHSDDKAYQAQQLVYEAWETSSDSREADLMKRALELNPRNVDALLYQLDGEDLALEQEIDTLRKIVAAGEQDLGEYFKSLTGLFWAAVETRPYMRARQRLAQALESAERMDEAIGEYEAMLVLNPNDNQGVRYTLLAWYLTVGRLEPARELFKKYDECEWNTVFAWCHVLERFLSGDLAGAEKALAVARDQNPYTQTYVKGHRALPREIPRSYQPGEKDEAICFADLLRAAWVKHPAALKWLAAQKIKK